MKNDEILLNEIYENSITAINVLSGILKKTEQKSMFNCLFDEMTEYRKVADTAYSMLDEMNALPKRNDAFSRTAIIASLGKPSPHRLARILICGSREGFYSLIDSVNACTNTKDEVRHLAYRLMEIEDKNINNMKKFLNDSKER